MSEGSGRASFDVVVVVDTTGSMDSYLIALQRFIPQLLAIRSITSASPTAIPIERVGILAYTDYYAPPVVNPSQLSVVNPIPANDAAAKALIPRLKIEDVVNWSGWVEGDGGSGGGDILVEWAKGLTAEGGGDYPEAAKTALKFLVGLVSSAASPPGRETLVLWYTDSPPHHRAHRSINRLLEIAAHNPPPASKFTPFNPFVGKETSFSVLNQPAPHLDIHKEQVMEGHPHIKSCTDWIHLSWAAKRTGLKVYAVLPPSMSDADASFWAVLGTITSGATCAIGGRRTSSWTESERESVNYENADTLETYVTGGEFVRTVTKLSLGIVLGELVSGESEGPTRTAEGKEEMAVDGPLELEIVRWVSYHSGDIHLLLQAESSAIEASHSAVLSAPLPPQPPSPDYPKFNDEEHLPVVESPPLKPVLVTDEDAGSQGFLPPPWKDHNMWKPSREVHREENGLCTLGRRISRSFMRRNSTYESLTDSGDKMKGYWDAVIAALKGVAKSDVEAISTVWLFSEGWRSVSKHPPSNARDSLFATYASQVDKVRDSEKKARLSKWGDINNDASVEISRLLQSQSPEGIISMDDSQERLFLTMDDEASEELPWTRERLLALTTSCESKVLKDAGYLLRYTRLENSSCKADQTRFIDLSTTDPSTVFRVLPHLLVHGTLYSPRTASILAIVALTSHIPHLIGPAKALLENTRGRWLNAATPENFSPQFVGFMLSLPSPQWVLSQEEHTSYDGMIRYAGLEENIDTKIQAKVPWTPMKTRGVGDRKRLCDGCGIRRSETMMHQVGTYVFGNMKAGKEEIEKGRDDGMRCGMCVDSETKDPKDWPDRGEIQSCWVECSERWCRAQYVIEDEEGLRIPPRCYYCRKRKPAPWIQCTICANRIILPKSYRVLPADSSSSFVCPPCQNSPHTGHRTIVHKLTTLRSILFANEYEVGWLGMRPFREIFRGRSTFVIWELYGNEIFTPLAPSTKSSPPLSPLTVMEKRKRLTLNGKTLVNPQELRDELDEIVERTMKKGKVLCGMTFEHVEEGETAVACGNEGCEFRASKKGLDEWYAGKGQRRRLCPSCRRSPLTV